MARDPQALRLGRGKHSADSGEGCLLEWASFLAGEQWSDHPKCVSPIIASFGRRWNDDLSDDDRQVLVDYVPRILNTKGTRHQEIERYWMVVDWMVRIYLPTWLDLAGLDAEADTVRRLPRVASEAAVDKALPAIEYARMQASAAWDAAGAAARAAARAATWDAARAAAGDVARDAAGGAAWDAAGAAAGDAARDAARDAAGDAAGDAAWDAARAAAGDVAWAAAWDAAWDAAGAAAWDAARAAARDAARAATRAAVWNAAGAAAGDVLAPTVIGLQWSALDLLDRLIAVTEVS